MVREADLGWIAGIIEGDGSITISEERRKERNNALRFVPLIEVCATLPVITNRAISVFAQLGIDAQLCAQKYGERKVIYRARLQNNFDMERFLLTLYPYLEAKKEQAFWMLEYFKQRRAEGKDKPYSDLSIAFARKVASLNVRKGVTRKKERR